MGLFINLTPLDISLATYPLNPPPLIREGDINRRGANAPLKHS